VDPAGLLVEKIPIRRLDRRQPPLTALVDDHQEEVDEKRGNAIGEHVPQDALLLLRRDPGRVQKAPKIIDVRVQRGHRRQELAVTLLLAVARRELEKRPGVVDGDRRGAHGPALLVTSGLEAPDVLAHETAVSLRIQASLDQALCRRQRDVDRLLAELLQHALALPVHLASRTLEDVRLLGLGSHHQLLTQPSGRLACLIEQALRLLPGAGELAGLLFHQATRLFPVLSSRVDRLLDLPLALFESARGR